MRHISRLAGPHRRWAAALVLLCAASAPLAAAAAPSAEKRLLIAPHATDTRLAAGEAEHLVVYDPAVDNAPLLVWLPGTGGQPASGPQLFFETALQQGYRVLALSYVNTPAVSQVCVGAVLRAQPACAGRMRQHRVWGDPASGLLPDRAEDAIVPRLSRLLQHLAQEDAAGRWGEYLDGTQPRWARVVLAGQSQGGGMAAYLAQTQRVAGVIMFSGGWDREPGGGIAAWYGRPSATPLLRWHASFHVQEPEADTMARIAQRLGLPAAHIHALQLPVQGRTPHGEGIRNPAYRPMWQQMLALQP